MVELNAGLLAILTALTTGLVQAIKAPFSDTAKATRFAPWIAIAVACAASALWTGLGAEVPEGVSAWAYFGVHGLFAGLSASGLYSAGKRVIPNGDK
jgi:hypothetical protein